MIVNANKLHGTCHEYRFTERIGVHMSIKIALAGNPNCGKTTLFNALTGSNQFVGNWPGVTVEKKRRSVERR